LQFIFWGIFYVPATIETDVCVYIYIYIYCILIEFVWKGIWVSYSYLKYFSRNLFSSTQISNYNVISIPSSFSIMLGLLALQHLAMILYNHHHRSCVASHIAWLRATHVIYLNSIWFLTILYMLIRNMHSWQIFPINWDLHTPINAK
jgi:hypothetical protein